MPDASATSSAWFFDRDDPERLRAAAVVAERRAAPDLELAVVSAREDVLTMQLTRGALRDPAALLFVEGKGLFELLRIEPWPGGRTLLVLKAWRADHPG